MKKTLITGICICISYICICQTTGDFRTSKNICENWEDISNWEYYNGSTWIPAFEFPGENYTPHQVTIASNCTANISCSIVQYPIQNLTIESNAICNILNVSISILDTLLINGTINSNSSIGLLEIGYCVINGSWVQNQPKTCTINKNLILKQAHISGNAIITFNIRGEIKSDSNSHISLSNTELISEGNATFSGVVDFIDISGDKIFKSNVFFKNCVLSVHAGETFECDSNMYFISSSILNKAFVNYTIGNSLYIENSTIQRYNDFFGIYNIQNHVIIPQNSNSTIESAELHISNNINIYGNLIITDKKGVKTCNGNFTVFPNGFFDNPGNDKIIIYGDLQNSGTLRNGTNGLFELRGSQNTINGNISLPRLQIEGNYINTNILEVKSDFTGNGTIIQAENSLLIVQSANSPTIDASAIGNTVRYTRRANQYANANFYYNLELTIVDHELIAMRDITILNTINFIKNCFINCKSYTLEFPNWNSNSIMGINSTLKGIILENGTLTINEIDSCEIAQIPLFKNNSEEGYARIDIQNFDSHNTQFSITNLLPFVTEYGDSVSMELDEYYINTTYHIVSLSNLTKLTMYWHINSELPGFEKLACSIMHYTNNQWEQLEEFKVANMIYSDNIFCISGFTNSFSPFTIGSLNSLLDISIYNFTVRQENNIIHISWNAYNEDCNNFYILEKSKDGKNFQEIYTKKTECNFNTNYYEYSESEFSDEIIYYRLVTLNAENEKNIYLVYPFQAKISENILFTIKNFELSINNNDVKRIELYSTNMKLLQVSNTNNIKIPQNVDIFIISIITSKNRINHIIKKPFTYTK